MLLFCLSTQDLSLKFNDAAGSSISSDPTANVVDVDAAVDTSALLSSKKRASPDGDVVGSSVFLKKDIKKEKE